MNIWRQLYKAGLYVRGTDIATRGEFAIRGRTSWDGIFSRKRVTPAQVTTNGVATYTIAQMQAGLILRDPIGANRADLLPTAALLVAAFKTPYVGLGFEFDIWNQSDHAGASEVITLTAPSGAVTLSPTVITIVRGERKRFIVEVTNITALSEAYTVHEVGRQREPTTMKKVITADIGTGAKVLTAAQMLGGIVHQDPGGAVNMTFATATLVIAAMDNPVVGSSFDLIICNDDTGAGLITLVAGDGNTLIPATQTVDLAEVLILRGVVTAIGTPAISYYGLGMVATFAS